MTDDQKPPVRLEDLANEGDGRKYSPSAGRNRHDLVDALAIELPDSGRLLEIAAGTGEHAILAAERLPDWTWWPTDRNDEALESIRAWVAHAGHANLVEPAFLDLHSEWPCGEQSLDAIFASNLLHIAPIETTEALFEGAARHLRPGGALLVYGAFFLPDVEPVESNRQFDEDLRQTDPRYGVRELTDLTERSLARDLLAPSVRPMPNNNFLLKFARRH
ncbi:MAG: DUF938 domain-containing protein [Planctomycetota bacterium]